MISGLLSIIFLMFGIAGNNTDYLIVSALFSISANIYYIVETIKNKRIEEILK